MIPEAAVEAAARAMYDSTAHDGYWDEIATDGEKATGRSYARTALEAAAPHMLASASADVAASFANVEAAKRALVARAAGVDPDTARSLGY